MNDIYKEDTHTHTRAHVSDIYLNMRLSASWDYLGMSSCFAAPGFQAPPPVDHEHVSCRQFLGMAWQPSGTTVTEVGAVETCTRLQLCKARGTESALFVRARAQS